MNKMQIKKVAKTSGYGILIAIPVLGTIVGMFFLMSALAPDPNVYSPNIPRGSSLYTAPANTTWGATGLVVKYNEKTSQVTIAVNMRTHFTPGKSQSAGTLDQIAVDNETVTYTLPLGGFVCANLGGSVVDPRRVVPGAEVFFWGTGSQDKALTPQTITLAQTWDQTLCPLSQVPAPAQDFQYPNATGMGY